MDPGKTGPAAPPRHGSGRNHNHPGCLRFILFVRNTTARLLATAGTTTSHRASSPLSPASSCHPAPPHAPHPAPRQGAGGLHFSFLHATAQAVFPGPTPPRPLTSLRRPDATSPASRRLPCDGSSTVAPMGIFLRRLPHFPLPPSFPGAVAIHPPPA
ncbi:hypothetical protein VPH35_072776 [Triticum aestivum]